MIIHLIWIASIMKWSLKNTKYSYNQSSSRCMQQNSWHLADVNGEFLFLTEMFYALFHILLEFISKGPTDNKAFTEVYLHHQP